ncbi:MAG: tyrosine--tRNA ligase [Chloroflexi bacterium 13_1_40CM_4_68_4]|nr:MAG: tyrosine--tRNA ligase [Chloroflexi bacterium 13_1_40CM_4_68_4]
MSTEERTEFFERAVAEVIDRASFERLLDSGRRLRWKLGLDPTRPDLHLGHAVGLRKLRQGARWGHEVILIVGDYTAQIGDPTDKDETRPVLSHEEVLRNAETYLEQFFRIVPKENVRIVMQSEWYGSFTLKQTIELSSRFTVQQMLAREEFRKRQTDGRPIPIKDLLYPLMQAYDSVAIQSDIEFGGTDQKFNNLLGRDLQAQVGQPPQQVFLWNLLPGLDGEKMSKSKRTTGIWLTDPPNEMYGKVMSLRDDLMPMYFDWATEMPWGEAKKTVAALESRSLKARDAKRLLARTIVNDLWGADRGEEAERAFDAQFKERVTPPPTKSVTVAGTTVLDALLSTGFASSKAEGRHMVQQGGIRLNGEVVKQWTQELAPGENLLQVGRVKVVTVERSA